MNKVKNLAGAIAIAGAVTASASNADAAVILVDFNNTNNETQDRVFGQYLDQNVLITTAQGTSNPGLVSWARTNTFNADKNGGTLSTNFSNLNVFIAMQDNTPFKFDSIDLADSTDNTQSTLPVSVRVTFNLTSGGAVEQIVNLDTVSGLQNFTFNQDYVSGITLRALGGNPRFQFDNLKVSTAAVNSPVPEPANWAMMIAGFGLVGGTLRSRRRQSAQMQLASC